MKKQIIYPTLIPRLFSTTLDLLLICLILPLIMSIIAKIVYILAFRDFLSTQNISWSSNVDIQIFYTREFLHYIQEHHKNMLYFGCIILVNIINILLVATYFVGFWKYKGATPGKIIMRMRLVDADSLDAPTTWQLIKRFIGYSSALFGIWSITFTTKRQALHDKIAKTVVIKA